MARDFAVDGLGLCRTEHMFFDAARITVMREMILADTDAERQAALDRLLPMQRADFARALRDHARAAGDDPPARPAAARVPAAGRRRAARRSPRRWACRSRRSSARARDARRGQPDARHARRPPRRHHARDLRDAGPRHLRGGDRGQPRAQRAGGARGDDPARLGQPRGGARQGAHRRHGRGGAGGAGRDARLPARRDGRDAARRAPRRRSRRARGVPVSFGTNDLTQMTYGLSRDDAGRFMRDYVNRGVFPEDPFHSLDLEGVGELMLIAAQRGRAAQPRRGARALRRARRRPARRCASARSRASTTSPARRSGCRSRGSPRRRRRCSPRRPGAEHRVKPLPADLARPRRRGQGGARPLPLGARDRRPTTRRWSRCSKPPGARRAASPSG